MGKFRKYDEEDMQKALASVKTGMKIKTAANLFNVPRSTLSYKSRGQHLRPQMGPDANIECENIIVQWLLEMKSRGFPVTRYHLLDSIKKMLDNLGMVITQFTNNRPGRKWISLFLKRHPEITMRTPQTLVQRRSVISEAVIKNWFTEVENYLKDNNLAYLLSESERVFNCDEAAFFLAPKGNKVLARKGDKTVYAVSGNDDKECLTVLLTVNSSGKKAPPMVVYKYARIPSEIATNFPEKWAIGRSENGWMTGSVFFEYITNVFYPWLLKKNIPRPVIFFLDGHTSHLTLQLSQFCSENGIILFALYPNATHILQPLDVGIFRPLKQTWRENVYSWRIEHDGDKLMKKDFGMLFYKTLKSIKPEIIQNAFKTCGLYPFDRNAIDYTRIIIPNKKTVVNEKEVLQSKSELKAFLAQLENRIPTEKLSAFNTGGATVLAEDTSLYNIWKEIKNDIQSVNNNPTLTEATAENEDVQINEIQNVQGCSFWTSSNTNVSTSTQMQETNNPTVTEATAENEDVQINEIQNVQGCSFWTSSNTNVSTSTQMQESSTQTSEITNNKTPTKVFPTAPDNIPTPFKHALSWPIANNFNKNKQQGKKKILPFAISSKEWQNYHKKKEIEKEMKITEKENRLKIRLKNKAKKERAALLKTKLSKKKEKESYGFVSDESDVESFTSLEEDEETYEIKINSYVLVKMQPEGKETVFFVGKVIERKSNGNLVIKFFRKSEKYQGSFVFPLLEDIGVIAEEDIERLLPDPIQTGITKRQKDIVRFNVNFDTYNLR